MIKLIDILNEYKINNPTKYPGATLVIYATGETLLDADSGEYYGDIGSDNNISYISNSSTIMNNNSTTMNNSNAMNNKQIAINKNKIE